MTRERAVYISRVVASGLALLAVGYFMGVQESPHIGPGQHTVITAYDNGTYSADGYEDNQLITTGHLRPDETLCEAWPWATECKSPIATDDKGVAWYVCPTQLRMYTDDGGRVSLETDKYLSATPCQRIPIK